MTYRAEPVERDGDCLIWMASRNADGYGHRWWQGRVQGAHRVAWQMANGPIPDGLGVLHSCDNPPCVNPAHLWLGTAADNARDRDAKGRRDWSHLLTATKPSGEAHAHRLSGAQVIEIRAALALGASKRGLGVQYGVSRSLIQFIASGRIWTDARWHGKEPDHD